MILKKMKGKAAYLRPLYIQQRSFWEATPRGPRPTFEEWIKERRPSFSRGPQLLTAKPGKVYHDPWERAEAWRYRPDPSSFQPTAIPTASNPASWIKFSGECVKHAWVNWPGFSWGVSAFVIAVAIEEGYNALFKEEDDHGHH